MEVSLCTRKGCEKSGFRSTNSLVKFTFSIQKARAAVAVYWTLFGSPFLVRTEKGEAVEKLGTNRL